MSTDNNVQEVSLIVQEVNFDSIPEDDKPYVFCPTFDYESPCYLFYYKENVGDEWQTYSIYSFQYKKKVVIFVERENSVSFAIYGTRKGTPLSNQMNEMVIQVTKNNVPVYSTILKKQ